MDRVRTKVKERENEGIEAKGALLLAVYRFANRRTLVHNCRSLSIRLFDVLPDSHKHHRHNSTARI